MDLNSLMDYLKSISTEEKAVLVSKEEIDEALNGEVIQTKLNNYSTLTLEMLKLSTDDNKYYKDFYNKLIEKNELNFKFTVKDEEIKEEYEFNKFKIIDALEWAKNHDKLNSDEIEKLRLLKFSVQFSNFIEKSKDDITCTVIEGNFVNLPVVHFIEVMQKDPKELKKIIKSSEYKDIKLDKFVYALDDYLDRNKILEKYYIPKGVSDNLKTLRDNVDITHINRCLDYEHTYLNKVKVNEKFKEELLKDIPEEFDNFEKAFYIYYQMCRKLTYDDEYFAKRFMDTNNIHTDFSRLSQIDSTNNKVICYEFNAIYASILKELGIIYELNGDKEYGVGHASLTFRAGKFIVNADSTVGMIKSDLAYAKNGLILTGFTLENKNELTYNEFVEKIDKVYSYISSKKETFEEFEGTVRDLKLFEKALPTDLSLEEKVSLFIAMSKDSTLETMDKIPYEIRLKKILFDKTNKDVFGINYISYEEDLEKEIYKTTKVLTYNYKGIDNFTSNKYVFIDPNGKIHKMKLDNIKFNLRSGIFKGIYNDKRTIPGVTLDEMNGLGTINLKLLGKSKGLNEDFRSLIFDEKKEYQKKRGTLSTAFNALNRLVDYNSNNPQENKTHK